MPTPVALATGSVTGRGPAEVLARAAALADREDARAEFEERRQRGERLNLTGLLEPPSARSVPALTTTARAIQKRAEAFRGRRGEAGG